MKFENEDFDKFFKFKNIKNNLKLYLTMIRDIVENYHIVEQLNEEINKIVNIYLENFVEKTKIVFFLIFYILNFLFFQKTPKNKRLNLTHLNSIKEFSIISSLMIFS